MLLSRINHVAVLTGDTERFLEFKLTLVLVGSSSELNVFAAARSQRHGRVRHGLWAHLEPVGSKAMGATDLDVGQGPDVTWTVLADPDGNEFCIADG